ncbi:hypothetical protein GUJ93_ZPchr0009g1414 [Zizania palustris]|uniref:Uncharacterized protein n=1 Tax=Zizania palustris TaxID=103762 RepID=A0A8J5RK02_ZIZPA|nr:hypothetical protein GUJ93_ZPchr0009g1414 [Zizania palustris]
MAVAGTVGAATTTVERRLVGRDETCEGSYSRTKQPNTGIVILYETLHKITEDSCSMKPTNLHEENCNGTFTKILFLCFRIECTTKSEDRTERK